MVGPRPPFPGSRRLQRDINNAPQPQDDTLNENTNSPEVQNANSLQFATRRRRGPAFNAGSETQESNPMQQQLGSRRMRAPFETNLEPGEQNVLPRRRRSPMGTNEINLEQPAEAEVFPRRRRGSFVQNDSEQPPEVNAMPRRRARNLTVNQPPGLNEAPAPLVPPVPEPKAKPARSDSALEAIIKLVNSILTFKGK